MNSELTIDAKQISVPVIAVEPSQAEVEFAAKIQRAAEARTANLDPSAASSIAELRRVVADILARVEYLEKVMDYERRCRTL